MDKITDSNAVEFSIVIPCLNEEKTLSAVIQKAFFSLVKTGIQGEVVVADNGSIDDSAIVAEKLGARVVHCPKKGYGNALRCGFESARGKYLIMGDADDSYNFDEIDGFVKYLRLGNDIVIGTRLKGKIEKGAMPFLHRYVGTPILTQSINFLFGTKISDCNCGMRGLTKDAFQKLKMESSGMEFASEMLIKAGILKLRIEEIPINFYRDKRDKPPHLHTWRDGWRHLKFILLFAPDFLFIWPSLGLFLIGTVLMLFQVGGPFFWKGVYMGIHSMILGLTLSILGVSIFQMGMIIKMYSHLNNYYVNERMIRWAKRITLEKELIVGGLTVLVGIGVDLFLVIRWAEHGFRDIFMPQLAIFGLDFIFIGLSFISFSLLRAVMRKEDD